MLGVGRLANPVNTEPPTLFFKFVKEHRGWYLVEYHPPHKGDRFATLNLVILGQHPAAKVAESMEHELTSWLQRYPIPVMASAFDETGDLFGLEGTRPCNHLIGYSSAQSKQPSMFWRLLRDEELPADALDPTVLLRVYADVPHKTSEETRRDAEAYVRRIRIGWAVVFAWTAVVPALWAIFEWAGPVWVGALVLGYSLWQALMRALKLLGKVQESPEEKAAREERGRMEHHHYHCERNPEAFLRLKLENFEREDRERIQAEAKALKDQMSAVPVQQGDAAGGRTGRS